jgi:hypothetical protein
MLRSRHDELMRHSEKRETECREKIAALEKAVKDAEAIADSAQKEEEAALRELDEIIEKLATPGSAWGQGRLHLPPGGGQGAWGWWALGLWCQKSSYGGCVHKGG